MVRVSLWTILLPVAAATTTSSITPITSIDVSTTMTSTAPTTDILGHWLRSLDIHIPKITTHIKDLGNVTLGPGSCTKFSLEHIDTTRSGTDVALRIDGLGLRCNLPMKTFLGEVDVEFEIGGSSAVELDLSFPSDGRPIPLPSAVHVGKRCHVEFEFPHRMNFTGGIAADVIEYTLRPIIGAALSHSAVMCPVIREIVNIGSKNLMGKASTWLHNAEAAGEVWLPHPSEPKDVHGDFVDIAGNALMPFLEKFLNKLGDQNSEHCLQKLVPGEISIAPDLSTTVPVKAVGDLKITLNSIDLVGLNSTTLALNAPKNTKHELFVGVGMSDFSLKMVLKLELNTSQGAVVEAVPLVEQFEINFKMSNFSFDTSAYMLLNASAWGQYKFLELLQWSAALGGLQDVHMRGLDLLLPDLGFALTSASAIRSGQLQGSSNSLESGLSDTINEFAGLALVEYGAAVGTIAHHLLGTSGRDFANEKVAGALSQPRPFTAAAPIYDGQNLKMVALVASILALVATIGVFAFVKEKVPVKNFGVEGLDSSMAEALGQRPGPDDVEEPTSVRKWESLATNPKLSLKVRIGLPLSILAITLLFLAANAGVSIDINMAVTAEGGAVVNVPPVFPETLLRNVIDMWGCVWPFSIFIGFFSAVWPYIKLGMMVFCWFMPVHKLSVHNRQKLLEFLDAFGKWSFVDTFISCMFMVAFDVNLACQGETTVPWLKSICQAAETDAGFRVYVQPLGGLYMLLFATIFSLACSIWMSALHRYAENIGEYAPAQDYDNHMGSGSKRRLCELLLPEGPIARFLHRCLPVFFAVAIVLCAVGAFMQTFRFNFGGVTSWLLGDKAQIDLSLVTLATQLPSHSLNPSDLGVHILMVFFLLFSGVSVVVFLAALLMLWVVPMTVRAHRKCLVYCQILNSVAGLDVFVATVLVSVLFLQTYAQFILGELHLDTINDLLPDIIPKIPFIADKIDGDQYEIRVFSRLQPGFPVLAAACIVSTVLGQVVLERASKALFDTEHRSLEESFADAGSFVGATAASQARSVGV